jgi:hypothetical protein
MEWEVDTSTQAFSIYVPNKDRDGKEIGNQRQWILEALRLLGTLGGGATAMPPVEGVWMNAGGEFIWENPVIVYSYIKPEHFIARWPELRAFLHRMGRETRKAKLSSSSTNGSIAFADLKRPEATTMVKKIVATDSPAKRIRDLGAAAPRIDPAPVANALGAEDTGITLGRVGGPLSSFQVRAQLLDRLRSSGGRPALEGATRRVKIPVTESQWRELEDLAASFTDLGFVPSAGQVASVLLSLSLPLAKSEPNLIKRELGARAAIVTEADR